MDDYECEWWIDDDRDSEELEEFTSCSSGPSSQDSLDLKDGLELEILVNQLMSEILQMAQKQVELEVQVKLEVQLEEAGVFWGPNVDRPMGEEEGLVLPGSCVPVEFADEETLVRVVVIEDEREQEQHHEVQTKSWWRRQADHVWKAIRSAANFCWGAMRCQRSTQVLPV